MAETADRYEADVEKAGVRAEQASYRDMREALEGIIHFADGFVVYHDKGAAGLALRGWINEARAIVERATLPTPGGSDER